MSEEHEQNSEDWRSDVSDSPGATLKIADGEEKTFVFLNEGKKQTHSDFGTSVVFSVEHEKETKNFYVRENNYSLLGQIKKLGKITGKAVKISRVGEKKSDTRYTLEVIED
jgi:hypothetical protein